MEMLRHKIFESKGKRFHLVVEASSRSEDYGRYEALRNEIWGFPDDHLAGTRNLLCENFLHEGASLFLAAYVEDPSGRWSEDESHLVGFAYGFVGVQEKNIAFRRQKNLWFYAQFLGVKDEWQGYGLGIAIKEWQREIVRDWFGINLIVCTYDPLTAVNAYRNVHYFGMELREYRIAPYGEYGGRLNRFDVPSDRFFMGWNLKLMPRQRGKKPEDIFRKARVLNEVEEEKVEGREGLAWLEVIREVNFSPDQSHVLVRIPRDFYTMLRVTDVSDSKVRQIPLDWRLKTREIFLSLLKQGYRLADFITSGEKTATEAYYLWVKK